MYGVGLQRVLEELQKRFPETPVHVFDRTAVSTNTAARKLIQQWDTQTKTILLGTEMSLTYLKNVRNISCTGIVSLDTLFSIPDFRIGAMPEDDLQGFSVPRMAKTLRHRLCYEFR